MRTPSACILVRFLASLLVCLAAAGCGNVKDKYQEQADVSGNAAANQAVRANNADLETKAKIMEADLARNQRFFQALQGKYSGQVVDPDTGILFNVRLEVASSVPPFDGSRTRAEAEIVSDLTNLFLNAQVVYSASAGDVKGITFGCNYSAVHPDIAKGTFVLQSTDMACPNVYAIYVQPDSSSLRSIPAGKRSARVAARSQNLASAILDGKTDVVPYINMIWKSNRQSLTLPVILVRTSANL
jgi:hypothetical protein